ncbi:MAG TPA: D-alanyl-D-alanine carboxypeptidase/D-alanyl-D-alanine-endopeptidase [Gemmatimonadaceae bacterium]|nr:D-alanyl-D-alanine carboxypeptidase/D-alanyl-D-alanine-endopeptidase [Gemmatimonadaceae bacterium]
MVRRALHQSLLVARAALVGVGIALFLGTLPSQALAAQQPEGSTLEEGAGSAAAPAEPQRRAKRSPRRARSRARSRAAVAPPLRHTTPSSAAALVSDLGTMLGARTRSGEWGVLVVSLTRGDTLYSFNPDGPLLPASNMKLYCTALSLDLLGPEHRFTTEVLRDGELATDGTLSGNLVLRGGGDPGFSSRFLGGTPAAPAESLAQRVVDAGVRRVRGDLVADASAYDAERIPEGWLSRYLGAGYAARVSALSLNENLVWIVVQPSVNGRPATVTLDPATEILVNSNVRTNGGRDARIMAHTTPAGTIEVRGWIGARAGERRYQVVVEDPAIFTAGAVRRALATRGVVIEGGTRAGLASERAAPLTALPSPPLSRLLSVMNRESNNHFAELIFRNAARVQLQQRTVTAAMANQLLQQFMVDKVGAAPGSVHAADGSGLSVLDRVTARSLVQLLSFAHRAPWADAFHASLPVAGESETLRGRMRLTPAQGNLHAKTGTTNRAISLGGYVTAEDGELLAFAMLYNGTDRWNARVTIDAMGATLASFRRE